MSEWKEYKLEQVIEKFIDYRGKTPNKKLSGIPLITAKIIKNGRLMDPTEFISEDDYKSWMTRGYPKINDLIITTEAPLGEVALINNEKVALAQRIITLQTKKDNCCSVFLKYYFQSHIGQGALQSRASGSTVEGIKSAELKKVEIFLPSLQEQTAIASVLSSLDDKIDLLHRQNKTLEQIAETLFRKWFVRRPELVEGEDAHEGWEKKSLLEFLELVGGGTPKTSNSEYWNGDIWWLSGGDISQNHKGVITKAEKTITEYGLNNSSAKLLPEYSTVITARGTVGKYCLIAEPMTFSQSNYGIKPKLDGCYFFAYLLLGSSIEQLLSAAYGSVFDTITTSTFKDYQVVLPKEIVIRKFEVVVRPYFEKIINNTKQIQSLTKMRDTLLPKLMSGEVRVKM